MDGVTTVSTHYKAPPSCIQAPKGWHAPSSSLFAVVPLPAGRKGAMKGGQAQVVGHYGKVLENDYGDGI